MIKTIYILIFSLFAFNASYSQMAPTPQPQKAAQNNANQTLVPAETNELQYYVENMPELPGGKDAIKNYVKANLRYPEEAKKKGIKGPVFVEVNVGKDGGLSNISVLNGLGYGCDEEALRLVKAMPKWKPGNQGGKTYIVLMRFPIMFELPGGPQMNNGGGKRN